MHVYRFHVGANHKPMPKTELFHAVAATLTS